MVIPKSIPTQPAHVTGCLHFKINIFPPYEGQPNTYTTESVRMDDVESLNTLTYAHLQTFLNR